jgi:arylsulfatase
VRSQFGHVNDIAPTIYEAAHITPPAVLNGVPQLPIEGSSLLASLGDPQAPEKHLTQYFEIFGNRAIYKDGWIAAAKRDYEPWNAFRQARRILTPNFDKDRWELYDISTDFSEAQDLASANPSRLEELKGEFDREARRNGVYPLVPLPFGAPEPTAGRSSFVYSGDVGALPVAVVPDLSGRSHRIEADLVVPAKNASGVIVADGGRYGGFSLYVQNGRLIYENNSFGQQRQKIIASELLPAGAIRVAYEFTVDDDGKAASPEVFAKVRPGVGRLYLGERLLGEARFEKFGGFRYNESFDIGRDRSSPVSNAYESPFAFTGRVNELRLKLL